VKHWYKLRAWLRRKRNPPAVVVSYGAQLTPRPIVSVSIHSTTGAMGVFTYEYNQQNNAHATLNAWALRDIGQMRLIDERGCGMFSPDPDVPTHCELCTNLASQHPEFFGRGG
jgi:hypothetical protein